MTLEDQLLEAHQTNQRLNRRCQELESQIAQDKLGSLINELKVEHTRTKWYADRLRDIYKKERSSLGREYSVLMLRLPKNPENSYYDSFERRIDYTLELLKKNSLFGIRF